MPRNPGKVIQDGIRRVLWEEWDPLGVNEFSNAADEYDSYIGRIYSLARDNATIEQIADALERIEHHEFGVPLATQRDRLIQVATMLQNVINR